MVDMAHDQGDGWYNWLRLGDQDGVLIAILISLSRFDLSFDDQMWVRAIITQCNIALQVHGNGHGGGSYDAILCHMILQGVVDLTDANCLYNGAT